MYKLATGFICALFATSGFAAEPLQRSIYLVDQAGSETRIGQLSLTASESGYATRVQLDNSLFTDHFLSMRPFRCISAETYQLCHLPYPYENRRQIQPDDLADLEYDLLFIRRSTTDYGINPWFGIYYRLAISSEGTLAYQGTLKEVDLDLLASPPPAGERRPISEDQLHPAGSDSHAWPSLRIK